MYKVPFLHSIINTLHHDCKTNRLILFKQTELERSNSKGNLSLCKTKYHPMKMCGEVEVYFYAFLTSRIYRYWLWASCSGHFTPRKKPPLLIELVCTLARSARSLITIVTELPPLPHSKWCTPKCSTHF
jgi:hypothetical protein